LKFKFEFEFGRWVLSYVFQIFFVVFNLFVEILFFDGLLIVTLNKSKFIGYFVIDIKIVLFFSQYIVVDETERLEVAASGDVVEFVYIADQVAVQLELLETAVAVESTQILDFVVVALQTLEPGEVAEPEEVLEVGAVDHQGFQLFEVDAECLQGRDGALV